MSRKKQGNPNKSSRFICLKCGNQNHVGDGIQRLHQRERLHIKDMYCTRQNINRKTRILLCKHDYELWIAYYTQRNWFEEIAKPIVDDISKQIKEIEAYFYHNGIWFATDYRTKNGEIIRFAASKSGKWATAMKSDGHPEVQEKTYADLAVSLQQYTIDNREKIIKEIWRI